MPTRRDLLRVLPLPLLLPLLSPAVGRASVSASSRKFLFVYCKGGWDPTYCFAPIYGSDAVDIESDSELATVGGLTYVDHGDRPTVRSFLERNHARVAFVNGFEVPSITHDRCSRILLTGRNSEGADDWGAILAGHTTEDLPLPFLVMSGPSYSADYTSEVVRVGTTGQLAALLDGRALSELPAPVAPPSPTTDGRIDAFLRERTAAWGAAAPSARHALLADRYLASLDKVDGIAPYSGSFSAFGGGDSRWNAFETAVASLEAGLSRCAMVEYDGLWSQTFDTHANNALQSYHFEELFQYLDDLMGLLDRGVSPSGARLAEEVTVVVLSEMGRGPKLNSWQGKDHYTVTSAMLIGGGVVGSRVVGGYDARMIGESVDLATGEPAEGGVALSAAHLGATLLAAGDVDPAEHLDAEPIGGLF